MLHVNGLTYRIGPRVLFDNATIALPPDARVGFLGRNVPDTDASVKPHTGQLRAIGMESDIKS